jgi:hypothetical protein
VKTVKSLARRDKAGENIASRVFHDPISYNAMRASYAKIFQRYNPPQYTPLA